MVGEEKGRARASKKSEQSMGKCLNSWILMRTEDGKKRLKAQERLETEPVKQKGEEKGLNHCQTLGTSEPQGLAQQAERSATATGSLCRGWAHAGSRRATLPAAPQAVALGWSSPWRGTTLTPPACSCPRAKASAAIPTPHPLPSSPPGPRSVQTPVCFLLERCPVHPESAAPG